MNLEWPVEEHAPEHPRWRAPLVAVLSVILAAEACALALVWWPALLGDPLELLALVVVAYVLLAPGAARG